MALQRALARTLARNRPAAISVIETTITSS